MPRLTIVEESLDHDVWGNYIDVEVADEDEELYILEIAGKHVKRKHRIMTVSYTHLTLPTKA